MIVSMLVLLIAETITNFLTSNRPTGNIKNSKKKTDEHSNIGIATHTKAKE